MATTGANALHAAVDAATVALSREQLQAVEQAVSRQVTVLCGGAGTGKTTTLRAIVAAHTRLYPDGHPLYLIALAGRAAKRMAEATGAPAMTIYRFLLEARQGRLNVEGGLLVVDEASMLDLPTAYALLRAVSPSMHLLFVGDPAQLPPIGPGLVFHRMVESERIARVELKSIQRQREKSTAINRFSPMNTRPWRGSAPEALTGSLPSTRMKSSRNASRK